MMNRFRFYMLFLALITTSCNWWWHKPPPLPYSYNLLLSFRDTLGNDLIKCITPDYCNVNTPPYNGVLRDDVIIGRYGVGSDYITNDTVRMNISEAVDISTFSGYYYVSFRTDSYDVMGMISFEIICPHIFGEYHPYKIVTYWEPGEKKYNECYRVEFEGKEFSVKRKEQALPYDPYYATITLDM